MYTQPSSERYFVFVRCAVILLAFHAATTSAGVSNSFDCSRLRDPTTLKLPEQAALMRRLAYDGCIKGIKQLLMLHKFLSNTNDPSPYSTDSLWRASPLDLASLGNHEEAARLLQDNGGLRSITDAERAELGVRLAGAHYDGTLVSMRDDTSFEAAREGRGVSHLGTILAEQASSSDSPHSVPTSSPSYGDLSPPAGTDGFAVSNSIYAASLAAVAEKARGFSAAYARTAANLANMNASASRGQPSPVFQQNSAYVASAAEGSSMSTGSPAAIYDHGLNQCVSLTGSDNNNPYERSDMYFYNGCSAPIVIRFRQPASGGWGDVQCGAGHRCMFGSMGIGANTKSNVMFAACPINDYIERPNGQSWAGVGAFTCRRQ